MRPRPLIRSIVALVAVAPAFLVVDSSAAAAVGGCATGVDDFDGNGGTDLAIGAPYADDKHGAVYVEMKAAGVVRQVVIHPPSTKQGFQFGTSVGEVDLSDHTDASVPCSNLVVANRHGSIFLYRWDSNTSNFALLNRITKKRFGSHLYGFGFELATPLEPTSTPTPRRPVLYVGAPETRGATGHLPRGAVVRLVLKPHGTVASSQVIQPGEHATAAMPMTRLGTKYFGDVLAGTPDPDEVIIGAASSRVHGAHDAGAVLDWRRGGTSTVLTENTAGVPGSAEDYDHFGGNLWLSHEAATVTGAPTYLFVAATGESIGKSYSAGGVWQFRYRPDAAQRIDTTSARLWTQGSPGVFGKVHDDANFGAAMQAVSLSGGTPEYAAYTGSDTPRLVGLGTGSNYLIGSGASVVSSWHDSDDNLTDDPFPMRANNWGAGVVVSYPRLDKIRVGTSSSTATTYRPTSDCDSPSFAYCGFGTSLSDTGE